MSFANHQNIVRYSPFQTSPKNLLKALFAGALTLRIIRKQTIE
jgi:hypothetical protein